MSRYGREHSEGMMREAFQPQGWPRTEGSANELDESRGCGVIDLANRAVRRRIQLPKHFSHPVIVESVEEHEGAVLVRVKRPDGGLEEVTLDASELESALTRATAATTELVSGIDLRNA